MATQRAHLRSTVPWAAVLLLLLTMPGSANAQDAGDGTYQISQRATVTQRLGNALISLDYARPQVRGRADVFGKVVHWGELWTPGANDASVLEVSEDVKLNGHAVPAGRWSMWVIPSKVGPWELVLDARDTLFHTERPELADDQIRFVIDVEQDRPSMEVLTWTFPDIAHDGGTLQMDWANVRIPLRVSVTSNRPTVTVAADVAAPYLGEWITTWEDEPGPPSVVRIEYDDAGRMLAHLPAMEPPPGAPAPPPIPDSLTAQEREREEAKRTLMQQSMSAWTLLMVPRAQGIFRWGWEDDGELLDVMDVFMEFESENGRPVRFTVRGGPGDQVYAHGVRRK